jgi:protein-S-isoprenylcysteine O-methyltransferase Ste14
VADAGDLVMFPICSCLPPLAIREEQEVVERFGEAWERYARKTPRFIPRLQRLPTNLLPDKS